MLIIIVYHIRRQKNVGIFYPPFVIFDHLVKLMSPGFFHGCIPIFTFVIDKCFIEKQSKTVPVSCLLSNTHPKSKITVMATKHGFSIFINSTLCFSCHSTWRQYFVSHLFILVWMHSFKLYSVNCNLSLLLFFKLLSMAVESLSASLSVFWYVLLFFRHFLLFFDTRYTRFSLYFSPFNPWSNYPDFF